MSNSKHESEIGGLFSLRRPERHEVRAHLAESRRTFLAYRSRARTRSHADLRAAYRDQAVQELQRYRALKRYLNACHVLPDGWYAACAREGAGA